MAAGYSGTGRGALRNGACQTVFVVLALGMGCEPRLGQFVGRNGPEPDAEVEDESDAAAGFELRDASALEAPAIRDAGELGIASWGTPQRTDASRGADADAAPDDGAVRDASATSPEWPLDGAVTAGDAGIHTISVGAARPVVDGELTDWVNSEWSDLSHAVFFAQSRDASPELRASCAWAFDGTVLYLAVIVRDDRHHNRFDGYDIWQGDSVQVAFDAGQGRQPYDWEYGVAGLEGRVESQRWLASDATQPPYLSAAVRREGDLTTYEFAFQPESLELRHMGDVPLRVSVAVNDSDDGARALALELAPGIVEAKSSEAFVQLRF